MAFEGFAESARNFDPNGYDRKLLADIGATKPLDQGTWNEFKKGTAKGTRNLTESVLATAEELGSEGAGDIRRRMVAEDEVRKGLGPSQGFLNHAANFVGQGVPEAGYQIGSMIGAAAISGGLGAPVALGRNVGLAFNVFSRSFGSRKQDLEAKGATEGEALLGAMVSVPVEFIVEKSLGLERIAGGAIDDYAGRLIKKGATREFADRAAKSWVGALKVPSTAAGRLLTTAVEETIEENIQLTADALIDKVITGEAQISPKDYWDTTFQSFFQSMPMGLLGAAFGGGRQDINRKNLDKQMTTVPTEATRQLAYMRGQAQTPEQVQANVQFMDQQTEAMRSILGQRFEAGEVDASLAVMRNMAENLASMDETRLPSDFMEGLIISFENGEVDLEAWNESNKIEDPEKQLAEKNRIIRQTPSFGQTYYEVTDRRMAIEAKGENDTREQAMFEGQTEEQLAEQLKDSADIRDEGVVAVHAFMATDKKTYENIYRRGIVHGVKIGGKTYRVHARGVVRTPQGGSFVVPAGDLVFVEDDSKTLAPELPDLNYENSRRINMDMADSLDPDAAFEGKKTEIQTRIDEGVEAEEEARAARIVRTELEQKRAQGREQVRKVTERRAKSVQKIRDNVVTTLNKALGVTLSQQPRTYSTDVGEGQSPAVGNRILRSFDELAEALGSDFDDEAAIARRTSEYEQALSKLTPEERAILVENGETLRAEFEEKQEWERKQVEKFRQKYAQTPQEARERLQAEKPTQEPIKSFEELEAQLRATSAQNPLAQEVAIREEQLELGLKFSEDTSPRAMYDIGQQAIRFFNTATAEDIIHEWTHHLTETTGLLPSQMRDDLAHHFTVDGQYDPEALVDNLMGYIRDKEIPDGTPQRIINAFAKMKQIMAGSAQASAHMLNDETLATFDRLFGFDLDAETYAVGESLQARAENAVGMNGNRGLVIDDETLFSEIFHGTPHVWRPEAGFPHGRPRLDKIGEGEGGAAFGWGWYSAESDAVARSYQSLGTSMVVLGGNEIADLEERGMRGLAIYVGEYESGNADTAALAEEIREYAQTQDSERNKSIAEMVADAVEAGRPVEMKKASLYRLDLPDDVQDKLLDWDNAVNDQMMASVMEALRDEGQGYTESVEGMLYGRYGKLARGTVPTGEALYGVLSEAFGSQQAASEFLARAGIVGTKYLDQGSRDSAYRVEPNDGTRPFKVVHSPSGAISGFFDTEELAQAAANKKQGDSTSNYVIWDQPTLDSIALLERNGEKLDAIRGVPPVPQAALEPNWDSADPLFEKPAEGVMFSEQPSYPAMQKIHGDALEPVGDVLFSSNPKQFPVPVSRLKALGNMGKSLSNVLGAEAQILSQVFPALLDSSKEGLTIKDTIRALTRAKKSGALADFMEGRTLNDDDTVSWIGSSDPNAKPRNIKVSQLRQRTNKGLISGNVKTGISLDWPISSCVPTSGCPRCYAASIIQSNTNQQANFVRNLLWAMHDPEGFGDAVLAELKERRASKSIKDIAAYSGRHLRFNAYGDLGFAEQVQAINHIIANMEDDTIGVVFSRNHTARWRGQGALDQIVVPEGKHVVINASVDAQLVDDYGIDALKALPKGWNLSYLWVGDQRDLGQFQKLLDADLFPIIHIDQSDYVKPEVRESIGDAYEKAGYSASTHEAAVCPCSVRFQPQAASCSQCQQATQGCFRWAEIPLSDEVLLGNAIQRVRVSIEKTKKSLKGTGKIRLYDGAIGEQTAQGEPAAKALFDRNKKGIAAAKAYLKSLASLEKALKKGSKASKELAKPIVSSERSLLSESPVTPQQDAEYQQAAEAGDTETAQRMVDERLEQVGAYWHGTPSGDLQGGVAGLHVGTKQAAMEALEARIGIPADGKGWDGSREYGKTLLAGRDRIESGQFGKYRVSGYNVGAPRQDYFPTKMPTVGDSVPIDPTWKPWIRPVLVVGNMTNTRATPISDSAANRRINRKRGAFYTNEGEDVGSVSAVLPDGEAVRVKLADPITRDDQGNVIPLSERFQSGEADIRFSETPTPEQVAAEAGIPDVFDAAQGIGAVPFNQEVGNRGFRMAMTPSQFRKLVPSGVSTEQTREHVRSELEAGKKIGQPFLSVEWEPTTGVWLVVDHEGRSRSDAFSDVHGQKNMEVHAFPVGMRSQDLTPEMRAAPLVSQDDYDNYLKEHAPTEDHQKTAALLEELGIAPLRLPSTVVSPDVRFSEIVTPQQDAEYQQAAEAGDTETAQRMVDEAAGRAGYITGLWHGGGLSAEPSKNASIARAENGGALFLAATKRVADGYAVGWEGAEPYAVKTDNPFRPSDIEGAAAPKWIKEWVSFWRSEDEWIDRFTGAEMSDSEVYDMIQRTELYTYDSDGKGERWHDFLATLSDHHDAFVGYDPTDSTQIAVVFSPEQVKSTLPATYDDQGNVIPLSERFQSTSPDIRFSEEPVTPQQDAEYKAAVNANDVEAQQKMVDEAATHALKGLRLQNAGVPEHMYHGSVHNNSTVFALDKTASGDPIHPDRVGRGLDKLGFWFTSSKPQATQYGKDITSGESKNLFDVFLHVKNPLEFQNKDDFVAWLEQYALHHGADKQFLEDTTGTWQRPPIGAFNAEAVRDRLRLGGKDGIVIWSSDLDGRFGLEEGEPMATWAIALDPNQIKSADPVTYDDEGNVIPLSERFQSESRDIRFSESPDIRLSESDRADGKIRQYIVARIAATFAMRKNEALDTVRRMATDMFPQVQPDEDGHILTQLNPAQLRELAREVAEVSRSEISNFRDGLAQAKHGKPFSEISADERAMIKAILRAHGIGVVQSHRDQQTIENEKAMREVGDSIGEELNNELAHRPVAGAGQAPSWGGHGRLSMVVNYLKEAWYAMRQFGHGIFNGVLLETYDPSTMLTLLSDNNPKSAFLTKIKPLLYRANQNYVNQRNRTLGKIDEFKKAHGIESFPHTMARPINLAGQDFRTEDALGFAMMARGDLRIVDGEFVNKQAEALFLSNGHQISPDRAQFAAIMQAAHDKVRADKGLAGLMDTMDDYFAWIKGEIDKKRNSMGDPDMGEVKGYFPLIREGGLFWDEDRIAAQIGITPEKFQAKVASDPRSRKRKALLGTVIRTDALSVFLQYTKQADTFIAKEAEVRTMLRGMEKAQGTMRLRGLEREFNTMHDLIKSERYYNGRMVPWSDGELMVRAFGSRFKLSVLAGNIPSILRQAFSAPVGAAELPVRDVWRVGANMVELTGYAMKNYGNLKAGVNVLDGHETWDKMVESGSIHTQSRHDPSEVDIEQAIKGVLGMEIGGLPLKEALVYPQRIVDQITRTSVWKAAYDSKRRSVGETEAVKFADEVVSMSQPAANISERAMMQKGNEYVRSMVPFTGQLFKNWNLFVGKMAIPSKTAWANGMREGGKVGAVNEMLSLFIGTEAAKERYGLNTGVGQKVTLAYVVPAIMLSTLARGRLPDDPEEFWGDMFAYNIMMIPLIGPAIGGKLMYDKWSRDSSPMFFNFLNGAGDMVRAMWKDGPKEATAEALNLAAETSGFPLRLKAVLGDALDGEFTDGNFDWIEYIQEDVMKFED